MARGWESKSVEEQQASLAQPQPTARALRTPGQAERERRREGLTLARKHLADQFQAARHPLHRHMLEKALAELDAQLSRLD